MNIIAVMSERGAFFKEEPLRQLQDTLEQKGFEVVLPSDREDLIKLLENNPRICGVILTGICTA